MRKKVTLALGAHGQMDWSKVCQTGMNTAFFRSSATPFIESIMKKRIFWGRSRQGLVIFECGWPLATYDPARVNRYLLEEMEGTLNAGKHNNDPRSNWGFNDLIVKANSSSCRIYCWLEMQTKDAMVKLAQYIAVTGSINNEMTQDQKIDLETMRLRLEMESSLLRDSTVLKMINQFRELRGSSLSGVLVLRGLAHKPMRILFDDSYDVEVKEDGNYLPHFYQEAMEKFYREGGLTNQEFERIARLMVTWYHILEEQDIAFFDVAGCRRAAKEAELLCK